MKKEPTIEEIKENLAYWTNLYSKWKYAHDPNFRKKKDAATLKWREKNKERWLAYSREYARHKKFQKNDWLVKSE